MQIFLNYFSQEKLNVLDWFEFWILIFIMTLILILIDLIGQIGLFIFLSNFHTIVKIYFLCYYWIEVVQLPVLAKPLTPVRPGSIGGVCCWTRSVSHGGTAAVGPSRSSSSSAVHHRLTPPPFPFFNVQLKVALAPLPERWRLDGCLAMKDRESARPPLSPPSRALPPRCSGTIVSQRHFLKRVVVPVWGPRRLVRQEGTEKGGHWATMRSGNTRGRAAAVIDRMWLSIMAAAAKEEEDSGKRTRTVASCFAQVPLRFRWGQHFDLY